MAWVFLVLHSFAPIGLRDPFRPTTVESVGRLVLPNSTAAGHVRLHLSAAACEFSERSLAGQENGSRPRWRNGSGGDCALAHGDHFHRLCPAGTSWDRGGSSPVSSRCPNASLRSSGPR